MPYHDENNYDENNNEAYRSNGQCHAFVLGTVAWGFS